MTEKDKNNYEDKRKRLILKIGVWFFSLLIIFFWFLNLIYSFNNNKKDNIQNKNDFVQEIKDFINKEIQNQDFVIFNEERDNNFLEKMKVNLEEKISTSSIEEKSNNEKLKTSTTKEEFISELEQRLLNESSSSSCPEFIDCMPTIDQIKPCVIPKGCENITQIAY